MKNVYRQNFVITKMSQQKRILFYKYANSVFQIHCFVRTEAFSPLFTDKLPNVSTRESES